MANEQNLKHFASIDAPIGSLAKQVIGTRYPIVIHKALMEMKPAERQAFIRAAVADKLTEIQS